MLQVTIHQKADSGIERQVGRLPRITIWIQRKLVLKYEQKESIHKPQHVDGEHSFQELFPIHFFSGVDTTNAEDEPLDGVHEVGDRSIAAEHFGDIPAQRKCQQHGNAGT